MEEQPKSEKQLIESHEKNEKGSLELHEESKQSLLKSQEKNEKQFHVLHNEPRKRFLECHENCEKREKFHARFMTTMDELDKEMQEFSRRSKEAWEEIDRITKERYKDRWDAGR